MTEELFVDDDARLRAADLIVAGEDAGKARRQVLYGLYLLALVLVAYGFPFLQAVFVTSDPLWMRAQLTGPGGIVGLTGGLAAVMAAAFLAGGQRGPVVPPMPYTDLVLSAPVDRAQALRRWWRLASLGSVGVGALVGLAVSGGLAYAGVMPPAVMVTVTAGAAVLANLVARVWFWGQVRSWPSPASGPRVLWDIPAGLRELHSESLRQHAAQGSTWAGVAMTGNIAVARLLLARPVRRGRSTRLRAGAPASTMVRRDVLGLRRMPWRVTLGVAATAVGGYLFSVAALDTRVPLVLGLVALPLLHLGIGAFAEGLRAQAANTGTPALVGISPWVELVCHLVAPMALGLVVVAAGAFGSGLLVGLADPVRAVAVLAVVVVVMGSHVVAAFNGAAPALTPQAAVAWYLLPGLATMVMGALLCSSLRVGWPSPLAYGVSLVALCLLAASRVSTALRDPHP